MQLIDPETKNPKFIHMLIGTSLFGEKKHIAKQFQIVMAPYLSETPKDLFLKIKNTEWYRYCKGCWETKQSWFYEYCDSCHMKNLEQKGIVLHSNENEIHFIKKRKIE